MPITYRKIYADNPNTRGPRRIVVGTEVKKGDSPPTYISKGRVKKKRSGPNIFSFLFQTNRDEISKKAEAKHEEAIKAMGGTYNKEAKEGTLEIGGTTITTGPVQFDMPDTNRVFDGPFVMKDLGMPDLQEYDAIRKRNLSVSANQMGEQEDMIRNFYGTRPPKQVPPNVFDFISTLMGK